MTYTPILFNDKPDRSTPITAEKLAYMQTQYQRAMEDAGNLADGMPVATLGHRFRVVAFALRNTGSGWSFIQDAGHEPIGVVGAPAVVGGYLRVMFDFVSSHVGALVVGADETFTLMGVTAGASVALGSTDIQFGKVGGCYDYVSWNGAAWVSQTGFVTSTTMNATTGVITFTHDVVTDALGGNVQLRTDGTNRASMGGMSATTTDVTVFPYNSTVPVKTPTADMRFFIQRTGVRVMAPASVVSASGNLWAFGIFEVDG